MVWILLAGPAGWAVVSRLGCRTGE